MSFMSKVRACCWLALGPAALMAAAARAQSTPPTPPRITVQGDAQILVAPDEVVLPIGVETQQEKLADSKKENDEIVKRIIDSATKLGVEPAHVRTEYVDIEPVRKWENDRLPPILGYRTRKTIVLTLKDVNAFEPVLTAVLEAGATHVHGIHFRTTELKKHRDHARAVAIAAAREKAVRLATELGRTVGDPYSVNEYNAGWWSWYGSWWGRTNNQYQSQQMVRVGAGEPNPEGTLAPGQIAVNAQVSVVFDLVPPTK